MDSETFEFIIVGGGPAGCSLAHTLVNSPARPKVLLLEAGGDYTDRKYRCGGRKWLDFQDPSRNWGYKSLPQKHLNNRVLDLSRGLGLGGSSSINFGSWVLGPAADFARWADVVGDDFFNWENSQRRFKSIETFHSEIPVEYRKKYAVGKSNDHGTTGKLHVGHIPKWERDFPEMLDAWQEFGHKYNPDHNSGNPIGVSMLINNEFNGIRSIATDLLLDDPSNLKVVCLSRVQRVIIKDGKAIGVESNNKKYFALKEVILSTGSLNTPHILMHTGLGPADQLRKFNIPVVRDIPAVGQNLKDHPAVVTVFSRREGSMDRAAFYGDRKKYDAASEQWDRDGTGILNWFACQGAGIWAKSDSILGLPEFKTLAANEQEFMKKETVPQWEIITSFPTNFFVPGMDAVDTSLFGIFLMNAQSHGEVILQSQDPSVPPAIDPKFLSHPFDRAAYIEALRNAMDFAHFPAFAKDTVADIAAPKSDSDEDLLAYLQENAYALWHMTGTAKMGKRGEPDAVVDTHFKVIGVEGLRIADMSVVPFLMNNHPQSTAYITGVACAERLIKEYNLE